MPVPDTDRAVLRAARVRLLHDERATMASIAAEAGIGVGSLYRRYPDKQTLVRAIAEDGLRHYIAIADACLSDTSDPWHAFASFLRRVVDSGSAQLTVQLLSKVEATPQLQVLAEQAVDCAERIFRAARGSGVLRTDVTRSDVALLLDQIVAIELGDDARTTQLRHRHLGILLDGLRADAATARLPGPPPSEDELAVRGLRPQPPRP